MCVNIGHVYFSHSIFQQIFINTYNSLETVQDIKGTNMKEMKILTSRSFKHSS